MKVDVGAAERAADRIVLAYEIADVLAAFAEDNPDRYATALTVAQIVAVYGLLQVNVPQREAVAEYTKAFRIVKRRMRKLGKEAKLSEVITEMHLDQRK